MGRGDGDHSDTGMMFDGGSFAMRVMAVGNSIAEHALE